jgi:hypothetical protein
MGIEPPDENERLVTVMLSGTTPGGDAGRLLVAAHPGAESAATAKKVGTTTRERARSM